jgi:hypothetical protein
MRLAKRMHTMTMALVVLMLTAASIQAGVIYDFVGTGSATPFTPPEPVAFQLTVPDFVNPPLNGPFVFFTCAQFDSSTNCAPSGEESFSNQSALGAFSAQLGFDATNGVEYDFFFPTGAFGAPGVYSAENGGPTFNLGTLTVTTTPEPTTMLLAVSGACLCGLLRLLTKRSTEA